MLRARNLVVFGIVFMALLGIGLPLLVKVRGLSDRTRSQEHLRRIGFALQHYADPGSDPPPGLQKTFPAATIVNPKLAPDERLSWYAGALPGLAPNDPILRRRELGKQLDPAAAWDVGRNRDASRVLIPSLVCPSIFQPPGPDEPAPTHYAGVAGLGADAATLAIDDPRAGPLRYDTPTPFDAIRDGLSHTIAVGETANDVGPWLRGGPGTARGLDPKREPYVGPGGPFGGCVAGGANFLYCDLSVQFLTDRVNRSVFRALVTIDGRDVDKPGEE